MKSRRKREEKGDGSLKLAVYGARIFRIYAKGYLCYTYLKDKWPIVPSDGQRPRRASGRFCILYTTLRISIPELFIYNFSILLSQYIAHQQLFALGELHQCLDYGMFKVTFARSLYIHYTCRSVKYGQFSPQKDHVLSCWLQECSLQFRILDVAILSNSGRF